MDLAPLVTLASGSPLIDIDWTAAVQFALFLLALLISNQLLFQPYLDLRERRKAGIEGARAEAERMTAKADASLAEYERSLAVARERAAEEGRKIRQAAAAHEKEVTDRARGTAQSAIDTAQAKVRAETEAARAQLMPQAAAIARAISAKLLGREVS
jgi:F-type H+-transporting ATPase subunit b